MYFKGNFATFHQVKKEREIKRNVNPANQLEKPWTNQS